MNVSLQLLAVLLLNNGLVLAQRGCLQSETSGEDIPFEDLGGDDSERLPTDSLVIVTSYQFQCCGNITRWQTYVEPSGNVEDREYSITFQVWRPGSGVEVDGCYSMIGEDFYANIPLSRDGLVDRVLEPANFLSIQPGDVVGYFMTRMGSANVNEGIQLEQRESDEGEEVWYFTNTPGNPLITGSATCVGDEESRTLRSFTNSAPVLNLDMAQFQCPGSTTPLQTRPPPTGTTPPPPPPSSPPSSPLTVPTVGAGTTEQQQQTGGVALGPGLAETTAEVGSNVDVIVGVAVTLLILVIMVVITLTLFLLKRRMALRGIGATGVADFSNPNYESSVSFIKTETKAIKKRSKSTPLPPPIALDITETAMYESVDPLDYTYPNPSPTSKQYFYIPTTTMRNGRGAGEGLDHMVGPHYEQSFSYGHNAAPAPPPIPSRYNMVSIGGLPVPTNFYHLLEDPAVYNSSLLYEDPTLPTIRGPAMDRETDAMFVFIGSYVPTEEQREMFASDDEQQEMVYPQTYNFFVEDQIYWAPASTTSDLYTQLASKKYREIHRNQIRILEQLGSGQFGVVCKALWTVNDLTLELAVKMLISGASEDDRIRFLQEAATTMSSSSMEW